MSLMDAGVKELYARQLAMLCVKAEKNYKKALVKLLEGDALNDETEAEVLRTVSVFSFFLSFFFLFFLVSFVCVCLCCVCAMVGYDSVMITFARVRSVSRNVGALLSTHKVKGRMSRNFGAIFFYRRGGGLYCQTTLHRYMCVHMGLVSECSSRVLLLGPCFFMLRRCPLSRLSITLRGAYPDKFVVFCRPKVKPCIYFCWSDGDGGRERSAGSSGTVR